MTSVTERAPLTALKSITDLKSLDKLNLPPAPSRSLLAHLHSGDVLRHTLPKLLKTGAVAWLAISVLMWLSSWPGIYAQFERWGLVNAFFAQMLSLAVACLIARITMLRADHLRILPADDFINLRSLSVLCRWLGEVALVSAVGSAVGLLLQPLGARLVPLVSRVWPGLGSAVSEGSPLTLLFTAPLAGLLVFVAAVFFFVLYAVAATFEVYLAIEFNTRPERRGREA